MKRTILLSAIVTAQLVAAVCATAAADAPSGGEPRFRKVFAFTDIGDDEHAAKLAELNVFAANCCDAGNRLKLDYCAQTCAWYFRWPAEKVRRYAETVVRGQRERWPFAHGVPFVAYGPWANGIDTDFGKTPEDLDRELRAVLESGAEYLSVHEIDSVIADSAVFAVFRKYCASPDRENADN